MVFIPRDQLAVDPFDTGGEVIPPRILAVIEDAQRAFFHELKDLLQKHSGQWIMYHGNRRIAISKSKSEAYQAGIDQGIDCSRLFVRKIRPRSHYSIGPGVL